MAPNDKTIRELSRQPFSAPDLTPSTEVSNAKATTETHPAESAIAQPLATANPPAPGAADTGHASTERQDLSAVNAPGGIETRHEPLKATRHGRIPAMNTTDNDTAVNAMFPQLGDTVRVSVDAVPYMQRREHHNVIVASGINGQIGHVIGQQVIGDTLFLRVETANANQLVPVDSCLLENPAARESQMQEPRLSPEKMRKPADGSYNKT